MVRMDHKQKRTTSTAMDSHTVLSLTNNPKSGPMSPIRASEEHGRLESNSEMPELNVSKMIKQNYMEVLEWKPLFESKHKWK